MGKSRRIQVTVADLDVEIPATVGADYPYAKARVDFRLSRLQAKTLRSITDGLERRGESLESGLPVDRPARAIVWMIEQVQKQVQSHG